MVINSCLPSCGSNTEDEFPNMPMLLLTATLSEEIPFQS